jgi:hypothetical protein
MSPEYKLTPAQLESITRLAFNWNLKVSDLLAYASPECGNPETACLMVPVGRDLTNPSMWIGIERNGHAHS